MRRENQNINNRNRLNPEAFEQEFSKLRVPTGKSKEQVWQSIFEIVSTESKANVVSIYPSIIRIAASVLLLLGISALMFFYVLGNVRVEVPRGKQIVHFLPDSSQVIINAQTNLLYNKNRWMLKRNVTLQGEALFRVKKGSRFQVQTQTATTAVLGTVFNVCSRGGITTVHCIEGKVSVKAVYSQHEVVLVKGGETKTNGSDMDQAISVDQNLQKVAWTQGEFYFNNTPISEVVEEIERQFDVDIFIDGDTSRNYTGYFSNRNLDSALEVVCIPMNLNWQVNDNVIILKENNR